MKFEKSHEITADTHNYCVDQIDISSETTETRVPDLQNSELETSTDQIQSERNSQAFDTESVSSDSETQTGEGDPKYSYRLLSYTVGVAGEITEKKKGVRQIGDKWFVLTEDDSWVLSTVYLAEAAPAIVRPVHMSNVKLPETHEEKRKSSNNLPLARKVNDSKSERNSGFYRDTCGWLFDRNNYYSLESLRLATYLNTRIAPPSIFSCFFR